MPTVKELEKENASLKEKVAGLEKALAEAKTVSASARPSKSRTQAEQVKAILDKDGKITKEQLLQINQKYPSDPIYYAKSLFKTVVVRKDGMYFTPKGLEAYEQDKAKAQPAANAPAEGQPAA